MFFNTSAAFSGTNIITDAFFAVYSLNVTWYGFYNFFDQTVDFKNRKNEGAMPFKMSAHYKHIRDFQVGNWLRNFGLWIVMYYYAACVCFILPYYAYGSVMDAEGRQVNIWTVGMMIYILCVIFTHLLFFTYFRHFDRTIVIIMVIIWVQWIIVANAINSSIKLDPMWHAVWENFWTPQFLMVFLVTITLMFAPAWLYRQTSALVLFPQFNYA